MVFTATYFLPPTDDFFPTPPKGPVNLGSIIANTSQPQRPLNVGAVIEVTPEAVSSHTETNWHKTISLSTGRGIGVYAQFLSIAGFDAELSLDHSTSETSVLAFDSMTTTVFEPSEAYIAEAVKAAAVQRHMKKSILGRKPVYLVTGIKTVTGAKIEYSTGGSKAFTAKVGIDLTATGEPVKFGPQGHWNKTSDDKTDFERASEFLFAFRVLKISYGATRGEDYNKGAFLDNEGTKEDEIPTAEEISADSVKGAAGIDELDGSEVICVPAS